MPKTLNVGAPSLFVTFIAWLALVLAVGVAVVAVAGLQYAEVISMLPQRLAIAAHLFGLWLQHELVHVLVQGTLGHVVLPQAAMGLFGNLATAAQVVAALVTLAAIALLAWVIGRLRSESVRQEFA